MGNNIAKKQVVSDYTLSLYGNRSGREHYLNLLYRESLSGYEKCISSLFLLAVDHQTENQHVDSIMTFLKKMDMNLLSADQQKTLKSFTSKRQLSNI